MRLHLEDGVAASAWQEPHDFISGDEEWCLWHRESGRKPDKLPRINDESGCRRVLQVIKNTLGMEKWNSWSTQIAVSSPSNFNLDLPGRRGRKSSQRLSCVPLVSLIYISLEKYYLQFFLSSSTVYILWRNKFSFRRYLGKGTRGDILTQWVRQTRFVLFATLYCRYCKKIKFAFFTGFLPGCIFFFLSFMIRSPVLRLS